MANLTNRNILLGITGGIAAYKSAELIRRLKDHGAEVRVVMTKAAQTFITPLTMQALSGNPVHTQLLDTEAEAGMGHIELARWADLIIIAPCSANFIARLAEGKADDLLTTLCLASKAPIALAPAMNQAMWSNSATQANMNTLQQRGLHILEPDEGSQACGDVGPGRMQEAEVIAAKLSEMFQTRLLEGKRVIITAGPTREAIDPVRYISNHSSGKMGYALAQAAIDAGAKVTLISGPVAIEPPDRATTINVVSAEQMRDAVMDNINDCDIFIASAAVADYRPKQIAEQKIKKNDDTMTVEMVRNPDIIAEVAAQADSLMTVGFAAETEHLIEHARAKLERKKLDLIIANDVSDSSIGFNSDLNEVTIVSAEQSTTLEKSNKSLLSYQIIEHIAEHLTKNLS